MDYFLIFELFLVTFMSDFNREERRENRRENRRKETDLFLCGCSFNRVVDFFAPLKSFLGVAGLDSVFEDDMKLMEGRFVMTCILYQKYLDIFCREFDTTPELLRNKTSPESDVQVLWTTIVDTLKPCH